MNEILITPAILAWLLWPAPLEMKPLEPFEWPAGEKQDRIALPDSAPPVETCPLAERFD
jgi:hypothetical protein